MSQVQVGARWHIGWESSDRYGWATALAVGGAIAFVMLGVFGLPGADLHAPPHYAGIMDPLCGMTRAMYALTTADLATAWRYNPGSFALAAFGAVFSSRGLVGFARGRWLRFPRVPRRFAWTIGVLTIAALWVNQQSHADLLMRP